MKSQQRENQGKMVSCPEHKEKCTFVCLHKTCANGFKIGCQKCRKDHGQHPNRLISITDFHKMLCRPIQYLENSTAFKLMNLKKKIEHIRNFRTSILEKEILLIESNQSIKTTTSAILEEHYRIRDVVSRIDMDTLAQHYDTYVEHLQKCREFLAYNPVKGNLVFNNEVIKSSRVALEKHIKNSHEVIDSIREFLVKIIEVLLANCAYDEDDDDIEFDNEGEDATSFNIIIKNRTDVTENPNIKNKIEHEAFLQMFDEEKDALNQQINILEKQLDFKVNILNKIRSTGSVAKPNPPEKSEPDEASNLSENDHDKLSLDEVRSSGKGESYKYKDNHSGEIMELRQEYETVLKNKEDYILELKQMYRRLEQKLQQQNQSLKVTCLDEQRYKAEIKNLSQSKNLIQGQLAQLQEIISTLNKKCQEKETEIFQLTNKLSSIQYQSQLKVNQVSESQMLLMETMNQKQQEYINEIIKLKQDLDKKQQEISKQKQKYRDLEVLVDKVRQNNAHSQQQLLQWRRDHEEREKRLRVELQSCQDSLETLKKKYSASDDRLKQAQRQKEELSKQLAVKTESIKQNQKQLEAKEKQIKQLNKKLASKLKQNENVQKLSHQSQLTAKHEQENKKIKQMKDMLEISIRKNQELKDKIYELETTVENYQYQLKKSSATSRVETSIKERRAFCADNNHEKVVQSTELAQLATVNSEFLNLPSAAFKQGLNLKHGKKQTYLEIKNIFKAVTDDMRTLEERLKENNVIEKVYLKELQRKRTENKNLKKQLQSFKVYGSNVRSPECARPSSPLFKGDKNKLQSKSPFKIQPQSAGGKKAVKSPK